MRLWLFIWCCEFCGASVGRFCCWPPEPDIGMGVVKGGRLSYEEGGRPSDEGGELGFRVPG